jgi:CRP-like cAMP-binding protein
LIDVVGTTQFRRNTWVVQLAKPLNSDHALRAWFFHLLINQDKDFIVLSKQPAEEKMAHFLIALSDRMRKRGFSSSEFTLSLTRQEIGNHLGLAMETVSRLLKKFQQQELILVKSKFIVLKNIPKLRAVSIHSK